MEHHSSSIVTSSVWPVTRLFHSFTEALLVLMRRPYWLRAKALHPRRLEEAADGQPSLQGQHMLHIIFGGILFVLFLGFWFWHSPTRRKLTREEIDHYLAAAEKLSLPEEEKAATLARLRAWAESDDGRPVYMLNLMRFYPQLRRFPGSPDFQGTPEQANEFYEKSVARLLFK